MKELTFPGGKYNAVVRVDFKPRKEDYGDEILEQTICLDDCLVETSTEDFQTLLDQGEPEEAGPKVKDPDDEEDEEDEEPEAPKAKGKKPSTNGENLPRAADLGIKKGSKVTHPEHGICDVVHVSSDGTSLSLEDSDGERHDVVGPDEVTLMKGKELKTKPVVVDPPKSSAKGKKPNPDEDEDDDEDVEFDDDEEGDSDMDDDEDDSDSFQDDDDDEPPPPPKKKPGRPKKT